MEYIAIFYWVGYVIVFIALLVFCGWILAHSEEIKRDKPNSDINIFDVLFALFFYPFLSWVLIFIFIMALVFEYYKKRKQDEI